jgi:hypothetical protein
VNEFREQVAAYDWEATLAISSSVAAWDTLSNDTKKAKYIGTDAQGLQIILYTNNPTQHDVQVSNYLNLSQSGIQNPTNTTPNYGPESLQKLRNTLIKGKCYRAQSSSNVFYLSDSLIGNKHLAMKFNENLTIFFSYTVAPQNSTNTVILIHTVPDDWCRAFS